MRTLLLAAAAAVLPGLARAEDNPACARFEDPLAYNACLASHGPKANDVGTRSESEALRRVGPEAEGPAAGPHRRPVAAAHAARRHGRIHMEFRVR
jgi:hypothetical protein